MYGVILGLLGERVKTEKVQKYRVFAHLQNARLFALLQTILLIIFYCVLDIVKSFWTLTDSPPKLSNQFWPALKQVKIPGEL